jgi:hypothetical protein
LVACPAIADTSTIASLATAGGTLALALATFASTRSANRAARVSEQALNVGLRPVLFNARPQDPPQKVGFIDHWLVLRDGLAAVRESAGNLYMAIPLRNVASGIAVLHGWHLWTEGITGGTLPAAIDDFRMHTRDLNVPSGDVSFWQGAIRDPKDPQYLPLREAIDTRGALFIDILYSDHEGGQRAITRFHLTPAPGPSRTSHGCGSVRRCAIGTSIDPTRARCKTRPAAPASAPAAPHECRRTFASLMIAAGVNAEGPERLMGHTRIGTTLDRSGHLMPGHESEARIAHG